MLSRYDENQNIQAIERLNCCIKCKKNASRGSFQTFLIVIQLFFFTKREIEALLAYAGLDQFPEMFPNRHVKDFFCT